MSSLFLDTEMTPPVYAAIAREARAAGLSLDEARAILMDEVCPALTFNLLDIAGEWAGFADELLVERIAGPRDAWPIRAVQAALGARKIREIIANEEWPRIEAALRAEG